MTTPSSYWEPRARTARGAGWIASAFERDQRVSVKNVLSLITYKIAPLYRKARPQCAQSTPFAIGIALAPAAELKPAAATRSSSIGGGILGRTSGRELDESAHRRARHRPARCHRRTPRDGRRHGRWHGRRHGARAAWAGIGRASSAVRPRSRESTVSGMSSMASALLIKARCCSLLLKLLEHGTPYRCAMARGSSRRSTRSAKCLWARRGARLTRRAAGRRRGHCRSASSSA